MQTIGVISSIIFVVVGSVFFIFATNYTGKHAIMGPLEITITPRFFYLVGWIYFIFEGILNVLPVMNDSDMKAHENFHYILAAALATLGLLYSSYGAIAYYYFGAGVYPDILIYFYIID